MKEIKPRVNPLVSRVIVQWHKALVDVYNQNAHMLSERQQNVYRNILIDSYPFLACDVTLDDEIFRVSFTIRQMECGSKEECCYKDYYLVFFKIYQCWYKLYDAGMIYAQRDHKSWMKECLGDPTEEDFHARIEELKKNLEERVSFSKSKFDRIAFFKDGIYQIKDEYALARFLFPDELNVSEMNLAYEFFLLNQMALDEYKKTLEYPFFLDMLPNDLQSFIIDSQDYSSFVKKINLEVADYIGSRLELWDVVVNVLKREGFIDKDIRRKEAAELILAICPKVQVPFDKLYNAMSRGLSDMALQNECEKLLKSAKSV